MFLFFVFHFFGFRPSRPDLETFLVFRNERWVKRCYQGHVGQDVTDFSRGKCLVKVSDISTQLATAAADITLPYTAHPIGRPDPWMERGTVGKKFPRAPSFSRHSPIYSEPVGVALQANCPIQVSAPC